MISFIWCIGMLFSAALCPPNEQGPRWQIIPVWCLAILLVWPYMVGWVLRDYMVSK